MENDLYKIRSLGGCLKAAYDLFSSNLRHILRRTWLPAVLVMVFESILVIAATLVSGLMAVPMLGSQPIGQPAPASEFIVPGVVLLVALLVSFAVSTWLYTIVVSLLNGESMKVNLPRIIRLALLFLAVVIGVNLITYFVSLIPMVGAKSMAEVSAKSMVGAIINVVLTIVFFIVLLPLVYSFMKYSMETGTKLASVFKRPYAVGWKHWGYIFMVVLLAAIIVTIICCLAGLPLIVCSLAYQSNLFSKMMGDGDGLPWMYYLLFFLAAAIYSLASTYANVWITMTFYYAYGHIEAKEKAKEQAKTELAQAGMEKETPTSKQPDFEEIK